jgi:GWxTD domain-containing protein
MHLPPKARIARIPALLAVFLLVSAAPKRLDDENGPVDLRRWLDGPVKWLAQTDEVKAFKALKTDDARAVFIEKFWARRDTTRETLVNEYRQQFWQRVREANDLFLDSPGPGWSSDRGRIYILFGPPTEIQEDIDVATEAGPTAGHGLIRWIYDRIGTRIGLDPTVVVPFIRNMSGEYKLSYDPKLSQIALDINKLREKHTAPYDTWLAGHADPSRSYLSVMLDLGRLQEVPPQEKILLDSVETVESYKTHPLTLEVAQYEPPAVEGSLVVVSVHLGSEPAEEGTAVLGKIVPRDASQATRILDEGSFRVEGKGADRIAQARVVVAAGVWDLTVMTVDPEAGGSTGVYRAPVAVRPRTTSLHLSDVSLTSALEPLAYRSLVSYDEPYVIGTFRVTPRGGKPFVRGDPIQLFYEIYEGQQPFHVSYQLEGRENDGRFIPLGRPSVLDSKERSQGFELPTGASWPAGEYRVRIEVEDADQQKAAAVVPVHLAATP